MMQEDKYNYMKGPLMNMEGLYTQCSQKTEQAEECSLDKASEKSKFLIEFTVFGYQMVSILFTNGSRAMYIDIYVYILSSVSAVIVSSWRR